MAVIGIDLGTTNSLVSVWKDGTVTVIPDELGNLFQPSVVAIDEEGHILTSWAAREEMAKCPLRGITAFKRRMGSDKPYKLGDREYRVEELSAIILRRLVKIAKEYLQEEITEAIISVPAYFDNEQRYATKDAAKLAGIKCERILNEPSAAALAARYCYHYEDEYMLVFDFGGGTLDVSVVECFEDIIEIKAIFGDNCLGGKEFDEAIAEAFCRENEIDWKHLDEVSRQFLCMKAKEVKEKLTFQNTCRMECEVNGKRGSYTLDAEELYQISEEIFEKIQNVVKAAVRDSYLRMSDITKVLLVGGSSRMPVVQDYLSKLFGRKVEMTGDVDQLVAMGVGVYTAIKTRQSEVKNVVMTDVCPFSLGTATYAAYSPETGYQKNTVMIERNSTLPARVTDTFYTVEDGQEEILFKIYQGEHFDPRHNIFLGEFRISIPPADAGEQSITVTYTYDLNGLLVVEGVCNATKEECKVVISGRNHRIKENKLKSMGEALRNLDYMNPEEMQKKTIIDMAMRLYESTTGQMREYVSRLIDSYKVNISDKSVITLRKMNREMLQNLLKVEREQREREEV